MPYADENALISYQYITLQSIKSNHLTVVDRELS